MNSVRHVAFIVLLCLTACSLAGCGRFIPHLVEPEPYSYDIPYPDGSEFKFEDYLSFGEQVAHQWDPNVKLDSFARLTPCDEIGSATEQWIGFRYWRPYPYWFGKRIEWLEIIISPDQPLALIRIWTGAPGTWDTSPTDLTRLKIDYATALQMADAAGGTEYKAGHSTCFQRVVLTENQWNFGYLEDKWGVSDDVLHLCIDGITGEPFEYFLLDDPPPKDEKLPADIAGHPRSRYSALEKTA